MKLRSNNYLHFLVGVRTVRLDLEHPDSWSWQPKTNSEAGDISLLVRVLGTLAVASQVAIGPRWRAEKMYTLSVLKPHYA